MSLENILERQDVPEDVKEEIRKDITNGKQVEETMLEHEEIYSFMFEENLTVHLLIDPDSGAIVDANPAASEFYGYSWEQLLTMSTNRTSPRSRHAQPNTSSQCLQGCPLSRSYLQYLNLGLQQLP